MHVHIEQAAVNSALTTPDQSAAIHERDLFNRLPAVKIAIRMAASQVNTDRLQATETKGCATFVHIIASTTNAPGNAIPVRLLPCKGMQQIPNP